MDKRRLTALIVGISCLAALAFAAVGCNSSTPETPAPTDSAASPAAGTAASPATDASPATK